MPVSRILDYDRSVAQLYRDITDYLICSQKLSNLALKH